MDGDGSGRYSRPERAKTTVGRCREIDINNLNDEGVLDPGYHGTMQWFRNGEEVASISLRRITSPDGEDALWLHYTVTPSVGEERRVDYRISLTYTECNFGGERPWFECPDTNCDKRVGKLYFSPRSESDRYLCRHCHDLGYESSQKSGKPFYENVLNPLDRIDAARKALRDGPFDRETLRECYEAQRALEQGYGQEFDSELSLIRSGSLEEWADRLLTRKLGYGFYGRCEATAKTTGARCRQSAVGEHGKCYYHGGAPGSGIGEDQRDHEAERVIESLATSDLETEQESERDLRRTKDLLADLDDGPENVPESIRG